MKQLSVPIVIVTQRREDVEFINKTLRDAGHPVRCLGVNQPERLEVALKNNPVHLVMHFADVHAVPVQDLARLRQLHSPKTRLVVVRASADESVIAEALRAGAQDLVSMTNPERLRSVCARELRAFRLEQALNESARSVALYKQQLSAFMSGSKDAIAQVQEGIVVEANRAWTDLLVDPEAGHPLGPLMDHFPNDSQPSLKQALVSCAKGETTGELLHVDALTARGQTLPVEIALETSTHDGEPAICMRLRPRTETVVAVAASAKADDPQESIIGTDAVTGFLRRQEFIEALSATLVRPSPAGTRALAYLRLDRFSEIVRAVGPIASDEVIAQCASILSPLLAETDVAGRFGGIVFAFVIERPGLTEVRDWAERALKQVEEHLFEIADRSLSLTCTIGIAEMGEGSDRIDDLIISAEKANRRGRRDGGNQVVIEETTDESTRIKRVDEIWVRQIRAALIEGRFRLVHLNIASLGGQSERMVDTVIRMIDEQGDEVSPRDFISTAARNKLLRTIDRWVIDATLTYCTRQANDLVFVKLSNESILDPSLAEWITQHTNKLQVKPRRLCFQVSEEDASHYQKQTVALAKRLRGLGYQFAVEHFGIGRDPMRVINNTPMDFVKFDGSLMKQLAGDFSIQEKLRNLVASAGRNNVKTIAEHVENANTMAILFQLGVGYMQGHYLHEPEVVLEAAM